jgi:cytochrome P450
VAFGLILPQNLPHRVAEDDIHDSYFIPKDSIVLTNIQCVHNRQLGTIRCSLAQSTVFSYSFISRDPRNYENPDLFDPIRFLGKEPELDPKQYIFGIGSRICPGRIMADSNFLLACAMILATLNILKAVDADGVEITLNDYIPQRFNRVCSRLCNG